MSISSCIFSINSQDTPLGPTMDNFTEAVCVLMAGLYSFNMDYPPSKFIKTNQNYVYEFIQKVLLELNPGNPSNKVRNLESMGYGN